MFLSQLDNRWSTRSSKSYSQDDCVGLSQETNSDNFAEGVGYVLYSLHGA